MPLSMMSFLVSEAKDTRNTFTSHLHAALVGKKINTYIDYELLRGQEIKPDLLEAIEESRLSVIILSQDYASSTWCLDELVHIFECKERHGQIVIPIFYRIDPSHVRLQRESYAAAFLQHEERFKDKVLKWKDALTKASKLSGFDSRNIGLESELVELVVKDIVMKLSRECCSDLKDLVGIESRIQQLESLLCIEGVGVRTVGIWGMGGVGKTTLADAVFNRLSSQFDASCFLANVGERSAKDGRLYDLRNELLSNLLKDESLRIGTPSIGSTSIKNRLSRAKVLVVLDELNDVSQIDILVGDQVQFGPGSRIIITTRDMHILRVMKQRHERADHDVMIYQAEKLNCHEAVQLFHLNDSEKISCRAEYTEVVGKVIHYAAGIPLALKLWGSLFRRCKSTQERESFLKRLKKFPEKRLQNVYRISYDALGENEKQIFLYIACFHKGHELRSAIEELNACGLFADSGIEVLIDMSLISIKDEGWSSLKGKTRYLWMHDVIQEMGWEIEREQHPEKPGKRSRLCTLEDVCHVLETNKGTVKVQSISLYLSRLTKINLSPQAFKKMCCLKFLKLYGEDRRDYYYYPWKDSNVHFNLQDLEYLPDSLIHLSWPEYTLNYLPSTFSAENLTELSMPGSQLQRLWVEGQKPRNLKRIDLSHSKQLVEVPNLSMSVNIERINLEGCKGLVELPSYFQTLHKLTWLNLSDCLNLSVLSDMPCNMVLLKLDGTAIGDLPPSVWSLEKLNELCLEGCKGIKNLPNITWKLYSLTFLKLSGTSIEALPSSIERLSGLEILVLEDCTRFTSLPTSICKLKSLQNIFLNGCSSFKNFPEILEPMERLEHLALRGTKFKELPSLIENIVGRKELLLPGCRSFVSISILPPPSAVLWCSLSKLDLSDCTMLEEIPDCIFSLNRLYELDVSGTIIRSIPSTINQASRLRRLMLMNCERIEALPELPCFLNWIDTSGCTRLKMVSGRTNAALKEGLNQSGSYVLHIFYSCVSLDENARRNIMDDAHLRNKATAYYPNFRYNIICPGSEIPNWVSYQMEGSSIDVTLPPNWFEDAKFLGLAFCVVMNFHGVEGRAYYSCCLSKTMYRTNNGESHTYQFRSSFSHYWIRCVDNNSDHLVAWYDSLEKVRSYSYSNATEASFVFKSHSWRKLHQFSASASASVKRCGVGFVYAQSGDGNVAKCQVMDEQRVVVAPSLISVQPSKPCFKNCR